MGSKREKSREDLHDSTVDEGIYDVLAEMKWPPS